MRRICIVAAVLVVLTVMRPVSAATTGKWDFGAAQASAQRAVQQMVQQAQDQVSQTHFEWNSVILDQILEAMGTK